MKFSPRLAALLLAISISIVTTSFLSLIEGITALALIVTALLSFASSYILVYLTLEYFVFNEINHIDKMLEDIKRSDFDFVRETDERALNPLKKINRDIYQYAQAKQSELEELKRMETYRKEFVADVSHELKTPLFAAQGFVHTLLDGAIEDPKVKNKFLKKAAKSLTGLEKLVQDLLTITKIEGGTLKMNFSVFDSHDVVQEVFDQFETKAHKKELQLCFLENSMLIAMVYGDRQKISQVILNLVSNAIKYSHDRESKISVGLKDVDEFIEVSVIDNGAGIPQEDINRIFERFYRVDKSRSKDTGGTGLGLSIVKHILEAHEQSISVESKIGKGSSFTFRLPKAEVVHQEADDADEKTI